MKAARINVGLTQAQAAKLLNIDKNTLRNWEQAVSYPAANKVPELTKIYGIRYDDIIFLPFINPLSVKSN